MRTIILLAALAISFIAHAGTEREYQTKWCTATGGYISDQIEDGTYPDCITDTHALEFDFGKKWAESIGQSLNYAMYTGRKPGIVLIVESQSDANGVRRVGRILDHYPLSIELVDVLRPEFLTE